MLSALWGCQAVEPRSADYYEHDRMWCGNFVTGLADARVAALATLTELKMPVYQEGPLRQGIFIDTKTPENFQGRVILMPLDWPDHGTRIGVRIGGFGTHREVCERLLDTMAVHLTAGRQAEAPGAVTLRPQTSQPALPPQPLPVRE
jgi:hypothetical protein